MNNPLKLLVSAGLAAATTYYFDATRGRYRRALVGDRFVHAGHRFKQTVNAAGRDTRNRAVGAAANLRSLFDVGQPTDEVLVARVRACLGHVVGHPHSIKAKATDGVVTLSGPILETEVPLLIDATLGVPGVRDLKNQLEVHAEAGHLPGLQGTPRRKSRRSELTQSRWSLSARAAAAAGGTLAALYGLGRRGPGGTLIVGAGLLLAGRAATNLGLRRLFGIGPERHAVDVQKTFRVHAPVEQVFELWDNFENFPRFMTHVTQVRRIQAGEKPRWHWTVRGPTGTEFEFGSIVTAREENRLLAWRTEERAFIHHAGRVNFHGDSDGSTTVSLRMAYYPVAGAVGHAIAWLFGADPKRQLDDDLMRLKNFLECGKAPQDSAPQVSVAKPSVEEQVSGDGGNREPSQRKQPSPG